MLIYRCVSEHLTTLMNLIYSLQHSYVELISNASSGDTQRLVTSQAHPIPLSPLNLVLPTAEPRVMELDEAVTHTR